jgi:hypothetical protein
MKQRAIPSGHRCRPMSAGTRFRKRARDWHLSAGDLRDFLLAYFASSVAAMAFII